MPANSDGIGLDCGGKKCPYRVLFFVGRAFSAEVQTAMGVHKPPSLRTSQPPTRDTADRSWRRSPAAGPLPGAISGGQVGHGCVGDVRDQGLFAADASPAGADVPAVVVGQPVAGELPE